MVEEYKDIIAQNQPNRKWRAHGLSMSNNISSDIIRLMNRFECKYEISHFGHITMVDLEEVKKM